MLWMSVALAGFGFDRIDVLSEDPGTFLSAEVPKLSSSTTIAGIRFVEQVKPVFTTPLEGLLVGLSLSTQSVYYEQPLTPGLGLTGGVQTRLGLPRGLLLGGYGRVGRLRVGLSANLLSGATWTRPDYTTWRVLPGVGIGVGQKLDR